MKLTVNNQEIETQATNLQQLAQEWELPAKGVAVAVNNRIIPRTEWQDFVLEPGAVIVIIKAACGG